MSLFTNPKEHAANPPETWTAHKHGNRWQLRTKDGGTLDTFDTKTAAEQARTTGFLADLYAVETRWYNGETIPGWRSYAELVPTRN